jgi:hypothetical protein
MAVVFAFACALCQAFHPTLKVDNRFHPVRLPSANGLKKTMNSIVASA